MSLVSQALSDVLRGAISEITLRSVVGRLGSLATRDTATLTADERNSIHSHAMLAVRLFAKGDKAVLEEALVRAFGGSSAAPVRVVEPTATTKVVQINREPDIVQARGDAWAEAVRIGFSRFASVKVATAVSELARNIVFYAVHGTVTLRSVDDRRSPSLTVVASDQGPGIAPDRLQQIFAGTYRSQRGMGQGLVAVKRLADTFDLRTAPGQGTTVSCSFKGGA